MPDVRVATWAFTPELCAQIVPRFRWTGSLGPAGVGNRCTQGHTWRAGDAPAERDTERWVFEELFRQMSLEGSVLQALGVDPDRVESWRAWASSTPAGVPIAPHAHDADVVVAVYLAAPEDPEPLEFVERIGSEAVLPGGVVVPCDEFAIVEQVYPAPGLALLWPSSLEHMVRPGPARPGDRVIAAWNVTLRRAA